MKNTKNSKITKTNRKTVKQTPEHGAFIGAIIKYWRGYMDFSGTSSRKDFWFAVLFVFLLDIFFAIIGIRILSALLTAVLFLPSRALAFRRYHDAGLSGLFNLIPYLIFFIWGGIRSEIWLFFLNLEFVPPELKLYGILLGIWGIFNLVVLLKKSKLKNNPYRK